MFFFVYVVEIYKFILFSKENKLKKNLINYKHTMLFYFIMQWGSILLFIFVKLAFFEIFAVALNIHFIVNLRVLEDFQDADVVAV